MVEGDAVVVVVGVVVVGLTTGLEPEDCFGLTFPLSAAGIDISLLITSLPVSSTDFGVTPKVIVLPASSGVVYHLLF